MRWDRVVRRSLVVALALALVAGSGDAVASTGQSPHDVQRVGGQSVGRSGPLIVPSGHIAFARPNGLWLMDPDGSDEVHVVDVPGARQPSWSPDGTRLVFTAGGDDDGLDLWTVDLTDTSAGPVQITHGTNAEHPSWSPYGDRIAFDSTADGSIWLVDPDGSDLHRLTTNHADVSPVWSPDGSHLAFIRSSDRATEVAHEILFNGDDIHRANVNEFVTSPAWMPSLQLALVLGRGSKRRIVYGNGAADLTDSRPSWNPMFVRAGTEMAYLAGPPGGVALELTKGRDPRTGQVLPSHVLIESVRGFDLAWQPAPGPCLSHDVDGLWTCHRAIRKARKFLGDPPILPVATWAMFTPKHRGWLVRFEGYTDIPHSQPFPPPYPCESGTTDVLMGARNGDVGGFGGSFFYVPCPEDAG